jgi:hypothetical protein
VVENTYEHTSSRIEVTSENDIRYLLFSKEGAPLMVMTYTIEQADHLGTCFIEAAMVASERAASNG